MASHPTEAPPNHPTVFTRRSLLKAAGLAGGALVLPGGLWLLSRRSPVAAADRRYFVFYYLLGGWDLINLTEPFVPGTPGFHVPYRKDEIIEAGAHRFGPAMAPLRPFFHRMGILRGVYARALNHPQAIFRLVTGAFKPPGPVVAPSVHSIIADRFKDRYPIPNLSGNQIRPIVFRGPLDERLEPVRVTSIRQLGTLLSVQGDTRAYQDEILKAVAQRDAMLRERSKDLDLPSRFARFADLARGVQGSRYGAQVARAARDSSGPDGETRWDKQANLAVQAIKHDLAACVTVGTNEFDSHTGSSYPSHRRQVLRAMNMVARIAEGLEDTPVQGGGTLLDRTTIVVGSEFSREPWLNELGGKHHWVANAFLFIGAGVKRAAPGQGPVVFGETDDGMKPVKIHPGTGSKGAGAIELESTHALATMLALAGVDPGPHFGVDPIAQILA